MQLVTIRDFCANPQKYFSLAEKEPVFVMRRGASPVSISVVKDVDIMSETELESIRKGLEDINNDQVCTMGDNESLEEMLDRIYGVHD